MRVGHIIVPCRASRRSAVTLLEILVVFAVISILMALLTPAVQVVRESARRTTCRYNLRQLGLAIANYESVHATFPSGTSHKQQLLPFIDRVSEYHLGTQVVIGPSVTPVYLQYLAIDIPLYACPSDPMPRVMNGPNGALIGSTDYAACSGIWFRNRNDFDGVFGQVNVSGFVKPADVLDGLSNTIAMSEIVHGDLSIYAGTELPHLRTVWNLTTAYNGSAQLDNFASDCGSIPPNAGQLGWTGNAGYRGIP